MGFWSKFFGFGKKDNTSEEPVQEASAVNEVEQTQSEENSAEVSQENEESTTNEQE